MGNDRYLLNTMPEVPFYKVKPLNIYMKFWWDVQRYASDIDPRIKHSLYKAAFI